MVEGYSLIHLFIQPWKPWCAEPDWLPFLILHAMYSVIKDIAISTYKKKCIIKLPPQECHLLSGSSKIESLATSVTDLQPTLNGVPDRDQDEAFSAPGNWQIKPSGRLFSWATFYEPGFLHLFVFRKARKPLTLCSLWLAATFYQDVCIVAHTSFPEITYLLTSSLTYLK